MVIALAAVPGAEAVINDFMQTPTVFGGLLLGAIAFFLWRRDVAAPEKNASNAILSGAAAHSAQVFETAQAALAAYLRTEKRFNALIAYTRELQGDMIQAGLPVPPFPDDVLD